MSAQNYLKQRNLQGTQSSVHFPYTDVRPRLKTVPMVETDAAITPNMYFVPPPHVQVPPSGWAVQVPVEASLRDDAPPPAGPAGP